MIIKEGQRLVIWVTQYPEGPKYNYDKEGHLLLIAYNEPTNDEIRDFKENPVEFGLFVGEGLIFLLYKFKNWEWADCPYNTHLLTPDLKVAPSAMVV